MDITNYTTYDLPVPYKKLKLYPVTVKDYVSFGVTSMCLTIDKNSIPDPKIISMTNLEYLYLASVNNIAEKPYIIWFDRMLSLCLKDDKSFENIEESINRYGFTDESRPRPYFLIENERYYSEDFEVIKEIIAQQNMVELIDENISKEVRDSLEKARQFKRKLTGDSATLEDYIVSLSVATGWTSEYIYSLTIRRFTKSLRRLDNLIHYKIYLAASLSGMVDFKDKSFIKHWLSSLDNDEKYSDVSVDYEEMENKISFESAKKDAQ